MLEASQDESVIKKFKREYLTEEKGIEQLEGHNLPGVMKERFSEVLNIYTRKSYETGYNHNIAFRILILYLYS